MTRDYLMTIDQETTSSRAIVFDTDTRIMSLAQEESPQIYPDGCSIRTTDHGA